MVSGYFKQHRGQFSYEEAAEERNSNVEYGEGTLKYADLCRQRGGDPDDWLVQSCYPVPTHFGPEDRQYSMVWLANEVNKKLNSK